MTNNISIDNIWKSLQETAELKINYKLTECNVPKDGFYAEYIFLEFINKTNKKVIVSWEPELFYNGECATCNLTGQEKVYTITLNPGESIIPNCDYNDDESRKLSIFSKWTMVKNKRTLSSYNLANITTKISH